MTDSLFSHRTTFLAAASVMALSLASVPAHASDAAPAGDPQLQKAADNGIAEGSDIVVTGTKANEIAPVTESLQTTQPQSIVSRSFIEDSLPATSTFSDIALIAPSVSSKGNTNGVGLSEAKTQIRGFQDGEFNVTYDGVPFGDTNDPSHHSNTFFPSNTVETLIVDRGPGNASQLGQATFGGNINMFSREARDEASGEFKASYGSFNTWLLRGLLQSGTVQSLGGSKFVLSGQAASTDGRLSYERYTAWNVFAKAQVPIGPDVTLTVLGTYNANKFHQPDNDGETLTQVAKLGKNFGLNKDPKSQDYYGYNYTTKTTDFEIVKLDANLSAHATFENTAYTYSYDNETLSGTDATLYGTVSPADELAADVVYLTPSFGKSGTKSFGVPGYTKTNKYRVAGDIVKTNFDFGFGTLTAGAWLEYANTYRQQRDVNLVTGAPDYAEKAVKDPITGATLPTPANIRFDQNSDTNQAEEFIQFELRPFAGLKITPGFKHVDFTRRINAEYNQTTRIPQQVTSTYSADLPFLQVNYAVTPRLAVYGEFAKGFLAPPLKALYVLNPGLSDLSPEKSTNYQGGFVYHGSHLSLDADYYYIDFANKFASVTSPVPGEGKIFINEGAVTYRGVEGQVTYAFNNGLALFANGSQNYAKTHNPGEPHTQVPNAPFWTAAGGVLFKHGPVRLSLIDKVIGPQYADNGEPAAYRIKAYNDAIVSARYRLGKAEFGVQVSDLFGTRSVTDISPGSSPEFDQYYFQPGREISGDITLHL
jgi:iron complex outermembrane receptor protein